MLPVEALFVLLAGGGALVSLIIAILAHSRIANLEASQRRMAQDIGTLTATVHKLTKAQAASQDMADPRQEPTPAPVENVRPPVIMPPAVPVVRDVLPPPQTRSTQPPRAIQPPSLIAAMDRAKATAQRITGDAHGSEAAKEVGEVEETQERPTSLEEKLGVRVFIWIAAIALVFAGGYLVKYAYENSLISPATRIALAWAFGAVVIGAGEFMLRKSRGIAQALTAAGVSTLFGATYAGMHVEQFISPVVGFAVMAAVAGFAVLLSLRQGPMVGLLGLVGGFATPMLVGSESRAPAVLFTYLFLLELGLIAITRRRGWWGLTLLSLLAGYGWVLLWLALNFQPGDERVLTLFILATSTLFILATTGTGFGDGPSGFFHGSPQLFNLVRWLGATVGLLFIGVILNVAGFGVTEWGVLLILGIACLALDRLDLQSRGLGWFATIASLAFIISWWVRQPDGNTPLFDGVVLIYGSVYALLPYAMLWRSERPVRWTRLTAVATVAYFVIGHNGAGFAMPQYGWTALAFLLVALLVTGAVLLYSRRGESEMDPAMSPLLIAAVTLAAIGAQIDLQLHHIAVAWAALLLLLAFTHLRLRLPVLTPAATTLAFLSAGLLLLNPDVLTQPVGATPIWNWLLYGFGAPMLLCWLAAWLLRKPQDAPVAAKVVESVAIFLAFCLLSIEVCHWFHLGQFPGTSLPDAVFGTELNSQQSGPGFAEPATYPIVWWTFAAGLLVAAFRWQRQTLRGWGAAILTLSFVYWLVVMGLIHNPVLRRFDVGTLPILNWLLYAYGLPIVLAWPLSATLLARHGWQRCVALLAGVAMLLAFLLINLSVRHWFHAPRLDQGPFTSAENYAYSTAWIFFALALLALGIFRRESALRWASLAVLLLAIGKVFLWDMSQLRDLWRVLSFLGLGMTLLGVAYLYQRFVFGFKHDRAKPGTE